MDNMVRVVFSFCEYFVCVCLEGRCWVWILFFEGISVKEMSCFWFGGRDVFFILSLFFKKWYFRLDGIFWEKYLDCWELWVYMRILISWGRMGLFRGVFSKIIKFSRKMRYRRFLGGFGERERKGGDY